MMADLRFIVFPSECLFAVSLLISGFSGSSEYKYQLFLSGPTLGKILDFCKIPHPHPPLKRFQKMQIFQNFTII